ncbi:MAG: zinc ribbon domain-containing protein [Armatimonadetes bacterium]|nr:zinc ribbon domain-containing protein [Armatimonadota bacterium]
MKAILILSGGGRVRVPLYEYVCNSCARKFTALVGVVSSADSPACPKCGGEDLTKLVSRFSRGRSDEDALDSLSDMAETSDPDDPSSMRKIMREMKGELGEDFGDDIEDILMSGGMEEGEET